jgi:vitamin B12 transporter
MKFRFAISMAVFLYVCSAVAQTNTLKTDPIIVTATRTARTVDETLAPVTVITRADIERRQARHLHDLLRGEVGLSVSNNGGAGKSTGAFIRGAESDHILVLVDGVKIGSATLGTAQLQDIPVEQIERIEIVRGPRSSLYGSEAIGGVVQIFTKKGGGSPTPFISVMGGSHDTHRETVGVTGGGEHGWFNASVSNFHTHGINACRGQPAVGGCFTSEPDKDGYQNRSGSVRAGYRVSATTEVDFTWLRAEGENEFDGSTTNQSDTLQEVLSGKIAFTPATAWRSSLVLGRNRDEGDNFKDGVFFSRFNTKRNTASWQNDVTIGASQLVTLGIDYQGDRVASTTNYPVTSRKNEGLFGQYQGQFGDHSVETSVRHDDNEQFGSQQTYGVAYGINITDALRATASFATAFKAPTFNELYFPGFGNTNLRPEESKSSNVGLRGQSNWGRWSIDTFYTEVDDLIAFDASISAPNNVELARLRGVELSIGTDAGNWTIDANTTWLDAENRSSGSNFGKELPRRAPRSFRLLTDRRFGRFATGFTIVAEDARYDDLANTRKLAGYATIDWRNQYAIDRDWSLQAVLANVFDKDYQTAAFFNQEGRSFFLTLRYQPAVK